VSRVVKASRPQARAFMRRAQLLGGGAPTIAAAIEHLGYVQIDPINVCGRMHDHILRNRVPGYAEEGLMRHLHGQETPLGPSHRTAFEHHGPSSDNLVAFPVSAWPYLRAAMRARAKRPSAWLGRLTPREKEFAAVILERFQEAGVLGPEEFADERRGRRVWGAATLAKSTLQKLFFHGRLLICARRLNRRLYDLPERVLPAAMLAAPEPGPSELARWEALTRLRQHRLAALTKAELAAVSDRVTEVAVEGCQRLFCLAEDEAYLEGPSPAGETLLLAPLDPLVYDRAVTRRLWDFDYAWEAYTPAHKRRRGYYALPVLAGTEIVGHVDVKADRAKGRLSVVSRKVRRGHATGPALAGLARFLGLRAR
jgi:uncharacterized protein YcaQ